MTKRILSLILALILSASILSACSIFEDKGEEATFRSDTDSADIAEVFSQTEEQLSKAKAATNVATNDAFQKSLTDSERNVVSFYGADNITIENETKIEKTVSLRTSGSVAVNSPVNSVVLLDATGGFTANAMIDYIVVEGQAVTCDINSDTGTVTVIGKDCVVNINKGSVEKIFVRNSTAIINNFTDSTIDVTLVNGTKVSVEKDKAYHLKDNLIKEAK